MKEKIKTYTAAQLQEEIDNSLERMRVILHETKEDAERFRKGNNTAGTRVRKALQEIKQLSQYCRLAIQEIKNKKK